MPLPKNLPPHVLSVLQDAVEVTLPTPDEFLKVKETLTRIGVASRKDNTLYQSCHILHKQGQYFIVHFKELFLLDGKVSQTVFDDDDKARRNTIAQMLAEWGLVNIVDDGRGLRLGTDRAAITVLPFREKGNWKLVAKYEVGKKRV
jgi:hypothetical protein